MKTERNRDILNIIGVLGAAIICAGLLAFSFLHYYSPSGQYLAGHTLLDPVVIGQVNDRDQRFGKERKTGSSFDQIEFSYFNLQKENVRIPSISLESYQKFYTMVAFERSIAEDHRKFQEFFSKTSPSLLTINMQSKERRGNGPTQVIQIVQFVPEDYFRVQLHEDKEGEWAYFYQKGLYQKIMHLFSSSN